MATKVNYTAPDFVNNSAPKLNGTNMANLATAAETAGQILDKETDAGRAIVEAANADAQKRANRYQKRCWQNGKKSGIESMSYRSK